MNSGGEMCDPSNFIFLLHLCFPGDIFSIAKPDPISLLYFHPPGMGLAEQKDKRVATLNVVKCKNNSIKKEVY